MIDRAQTTLLVRLERRLRIRLDEMCEPRHEIRAIVWCKVMAALDWRRQGRRVRR